MSIKDQELAQAKIRIIISSFILLAFSVSVYVFSKTIYAIAIPLMLSHLVVSLILFVIVSKYPVDLRKTIAIILDTGATSLAIYMFGINGVFVYPVYLWVIVGNGIRFGVKYLVIALITTLLFFSFSVWANEEWHNHLAFTTTLFFSFIILSLFYIKIIKQLHILNDKLKTELKKTKHLSLHDTLTNLPNRSFFNINFKKELARSKRYDNFFAVGYIDLNSFKPVNDDYGHEYGDELLQQVSVRMKDSLRGEDFIARLGGDEFGILLIEPNNMENAQMCIDRLKQAVAKPYDILGETINISTSVGMAVYPYDGKSQDELLRQADHNMYKNKEKEKKEGQIAKR